MMLIITNIQAPITMVNIINKTINSVFYFYNFVYISSNILLSSTTAIYNSFEFFDISYIITLSSTYLMIYDYKPSNVSWNFV